jgi:CHAT domain-containing protein/tetratricopeptide (TPR) repeat protein
MKIQKYSLSLLLFFIIVIPAVHVFSGEFQNQILSNSSVQVDFNELFERGEAERANGRFEEAVGFIEEVLQAARLTDDPLRQAQSLLSLGLLYWNLGQMDKSETHFKEALSFLEDSRPELKERTLDSLEIYRLYSLGKDSRSQGFYQESIKAFTQAIELAETINSPEHLVKCLRQLGVTHWERGANEEFYRANSRALSIAQSLHHGTEEGRCSYNVGLYFSKTFDYSQALKHYEDALQIFRESRNIHDESYCLTNISDIFIQLGDYDKALEYLNEVLRIDYELEEVQYAAMDLNNIGVIYRKKGLLSKHEQDLDRARKAFEESLAAARSIQDAQTEIQCLNNLGTVFTDLGKYSEALDYLSQGLEKAENLGEKEELTKLMVNKGAVYYKQGRYTQSVEALQQAIELAQQIREDNSLWEAHARAGDALKMLHKNHLALDEYKKSISVIESIRSKIQMEELKASFLGSDARIDSYYNMIDVLVRLSEEESEKNYDREALHYVEKAKARAFLDRLELSQIDLRSGVDRNFLDGEEELMKAIAGFNSRLIESNLTQEQRSELFEQMKRSEEELGALKRKMRIANPVYAGLKYPSVVTVEEAQALIKDEATAFFVYCIGGESSFAFVIEKDKFRIFPLPSAEEIRSSVKSYLQIISDKDSQNFDLGYTMFLALVRPGLQPKIKNIVFIPDDILHFLPFETLVAQKKSRRWLIQDYKVSYVPSITALREIRLREEMEKVRPKKDLLAFGDPHFSLEGEDKRYSVFPGRDLTESKRLSRLEYSRLEVEGISELFRKSKRDIYTGEQATEERLKEASLADYQVVHLATHGFIDNLSPARSSIIFSIASNSEEDGFLQMREVFGLKFNADLVSLSACQTALGQFIKGEGIEGISRAFLFAGASSVLMSLWSVNDQASFQFMQRFYSHLASSQTAVDALCRSKLEMIHSTELAHPFYWAGFVITGDADKVIFSPRRKRWIVSFFFLAAALGFFLLVPRKKVVVSPLAPPSCNSITTK